VRALAYFRKRNSQHWEAPEDPLPVAGLRGSHARYDSLNRLATAETTTGSLLEWGLSFGYDGFGNKTSQSVAQGSGPTWSQTISTATNRVNAYTYDLNGNVTAMPGKTLSWDVLNRMTQVVESGGTEEYDYARSGQRMEEFPASVNGTVLEFTSHGRDVYFAGRLIYQRGEQVFTDRLGSMSLQVRGRAPQATPPTGAIVRGAVGMRIGITRRVGL
jgi:hypothetical protein